jgi:hypothetical protein
MTTLKKIQDEYFTLARESKSRWCGSPARWKRLMARFVPERPTFMAKLPTVAELVDNQLKFRRRFVDEQLMFVRKMMKAMDPMVTRLDTVAKPVAVPKPVMHMPAKATASRMAPRRVGSKVA